jgi:hypothetical protein
VSPYDPGLVALSSIGLRGSTRRGLMRFYCPTGLFNGISVDTPKSATWRCQSCRHRRNRRERVLSVGNPHLYVTTLPVLLSRMYQIWFEGRHTAMSVLQSPS